MANKDTFFAEVGVFVRHPEFPYKSVILAIFLTVIGIGLIGNKYLCLF